MTIDTQNFLQKLERIIFSSIILFLPTQLGKHFWPPFSFVDGIRVDYLSPTLYVTDILIGLLLAIWIKDKKFITHKSSIIILCFVVLLLIGILQSHSPLAGFYKLLKIIEMGFLGFYIATAIGKKDVERMVLLFSIGILCESVLAIAQFLKQASIGGIFWLFGERTFSGQTVGIANASLDGRLVLRPYGTFPHPNVLAGYLLIAMTIVISNIKYQISKLKNAVFFVALLIGTIALVFTLSRVAIVLWMVIVGLFVFKFIIHHSSLIIRLLLALLFIGGIGVIGFSPLSSRFTSLLASDFDTIQRRGDLNRVAIEMVKAHPLIGVGLNNFLTELPKWQKPTAGPLWLQPVHNIYLLVLAETGIVGFGFFLWFLWRTYERIKNKKFIIHRSPALPAGRSLTILSIVLFLGMFDHYFVTLQQGQMLAAAVFGFLWLRRV